MLGRSVGLTEEQLAHLGDDPLPEGVYSPSEAAIVRYARQSTLHITIDDALYAELATYFSRQQIIDICLVVGQSNVVNRFHATFLTDVDPSTIETVNAPGTCPIPLPEYAKASAERT
jgi:alkylhydroperoxidase family enzyme